MNESATLTPPVSARDHTQGTDGAPLTLVEYGDYQCPYCGTTHLVVKQLQKTFGHRLRFVFRNYPLFQSHAYALDAAQAAEAADLQGKFWEMHDLMYENQRFLGPDIFPVWAKEAGLDLEKFKAALQHGDIMKRIKEDRASGIQSGVAGTPSFFINGSFYDGLLDYDSFRTVLEKQLIK